MNTTERRWHIINNVPTLDSKPSWVPKADEIYSAMIEFDYSKGISEKDSECLGNLIEFSRLPAELKILIHVSNDGVLEARYIAISATGHQLILLHNHEADHVVINNIWYPFMPDAISVAEDRLKVAGINSVGRITLGQYLILTKNNDDLIVNEIAPGDLKLWDRYPDSIPEGISATLYPYQTKGWKWLKFLANEKLGGILADEMGLGKTLQIISVVTTETKALKSPSLIVSPTTLLENWRREFQKFAPQVSTLIHQGADRTGFPKDLLKHDVVITSYDTVIRDSSLFSKINWNIVVCDEAQAIKNPETKRAFAIKKIPRNVAFAVTGTPVENCLTDLWSIFDFSVPGFLGSREDFEGRYDDSTTAASKLEERISPLLLRRLVSEVADDLPAKIIIPQVLEMSEAEAVRYEQIRIETLQEFQGNASLVVLVRLRLFCTHPFLIDGQFTDDPAICSQKYGRLVEIADEVVQNGAKLLVFSSFSQMIDIIKNDLANRFGIYTNSIDGRTPVGDRQKIVDEFSSVNGPAVLVLNPIAAGAGLNITAANHVVHYNLEWNPAKEDQASARAYRRGQDRPVTIHRLYYADTVEEAIDDRLNRKRTLSAAAIVGVQGEEGDMNDLVSAIQKSPKSKK